MSCKNCYNGCAETVSDKCIKYTGPDINELGISNGDTLLHVEQTLSNFIISFLQGSDIVPNIDENIICSVISENLPTQELNLNNILNSLIKVVCEVYTKTIQTSADLLELNSNYNIQCLEDVNADSHTHSIIQALINKLCTLLNDFNTYVNVIAPNEYVTAAQVAQIVQTYFQTQPISSKYYTRMVPYAIVDWYGDPTGKFDTTGAGLPSSPWEKLYLCNGLNNTPDLRGLTTAGAIVGAGGGALSPQVDPNNSLNPNYAVGTVVGANGVSLQLQEMPPHTHDAVATSEPHTHTGSVVPDTILYYGGAPTQPISYKRAAPESGGNVGGKIGGTLDISQQTVSVNVSIQPSGAGQPHTNTQPTMGMHKIIYIP